MYKINITYWQNPLLKVSTWFLISIYLAPIAATAQILTDPITPKTTEQAWQAPNLAALPSDWWSSLTSSSTELTNQRASEFLDALDQRVTALNGNELVTTQNGLIYIKSQFELLALAKQGAGCSAL